MMHYGNGDKLNTEVIKAFIFDILIALIC